VQRKIIHVDMDCFYAAVEIRDNPSLADKPVAEGGSSERRGVLCTCNYVAREYGVRSAMPTSYAYKLCKDLIVLPVDMNKYREAANRIHYIFREFTELVEPLSLDEAYLDVSNSPHLNGSATLIAQEIRRRIWDEVNLTASAGVAPNKFLAKVASGWKKPNGLFVIRPQDVSGFVKDLPLNKLFGVGKVTAGKLNNLSFKICSDLYSISLPELTDKFGKLGKQLYEQSRGVDNRSVEPNRIRKSLSVEQTFTEDIKTTEQCISAINDLFAKLIKRLEEADINLPIKNQYIKIKYNNFKQTTIERTCESPNLVQYQKLLYEINIPLNSSIRLLGLGIHFKTDNDPHKLIQLSLF
jgi:DNA polymerase-4